MLSTQLLLCVTVPSFLTASCMSGLLLDWIWPVITISGPQLLLCVVACLRMLGQLLSPAVCTGGAVCQVASRPLPSLVFPRPGRRINPYVGTPT